MEEKLSYDVMWSVELLENKIQIKYLFKPCFFICCKKSVKSKYLGYLIQHVVNQHVHYAPENFEMWS